MVAPTQAVRHDLSKGSPNAQVQAVMSSMALRIYKNELYVPVFCISIDVE